MNHLITSFISYYVLFYKIFFLHILTDITVFWTVVQNHFILIVSKFMYIHGNTHENKLQLEHLWGMATCALHQKLLQLQKLLSHTWQIISGSKYEMGFSCQSLYKFLIPPAAVHVNCILQISSFFANELLRIVRDTILHMTRH